MSFPSSVALWPFVVALVILLLVCGVWLILAFHPILRDRYDHVARSRFHAELRWFHVHLVLALIIALLLGPLLFAGAYYVGYQTATRYDRAYFASHYQNPGLCLRVAHHHCVLSVPHLTQELPRTAAPVHAPAQATVDLTKYPSVGDQGPNGSCAAWASAWAASYEYRVLHPKSTLRFAPRCEYDDYSGKYSGGQDAGSFAEDDVQAITAGRVPRFYRVPYGKVVNGRPTYGVDLPFPQDCTIYAVKTPLYVQSLTPYALGAGQAAVDAVRGSISGTNTVDRKPHPVMFAFPVYPEYDNATVQPNIVSPNASEADRGGHENVIIGYDDTKLMPDGTVGAVLIQNQWNIYWGQGGRAWMSYDFLRRYSYGLEYLTSSPGVAHAGKNAPPADGGHKPLPPLVTVSHPPSATAPPAPQAAGWYVDTSPNHTPYALDTHRAIAPLVNAAGDKWGIWPVYLLAVVMAESAMREHAARWGLWPDVSFGFVQVTVQTLTAYYSGCGFNSYCAQAYLDNGPTAIDLGAHILHDYKAMTGVGYPGLWQCYNAGPGSCQSPYYSGFLSNYYVALTYATNSAPAPAPKPVPKKIVFPKAAWHAWCVRHPHKSCQPAHWKGKLSWAASVWMNFQGLKGVVGREVFVPRSRQTSHSYTVTHFQYGQIVCWQSYHRCGVYGAEGRLLGRR